MRITLFIAILSPLVAQVLAQGQEPFSRDGRIITETVSFSEESPSTSRFQSELVAGMKCFGDFCDQKRLITVRDGPLYPVTFSGYESIWFSEESPNEAICPPDMVLSQIWCRGRFCDSLKIGCGRLTGNYFTSPTELYTTEYFSEERGGTRFCPDTYYIQGIKCRGNFCDSMQLKCVRVYYIPQTTDRCTILNDPVGYLQEGNWFSEERGGLSDLTTEPVVGFQCAGRFCDNKRMITLQNQTTAAVSASTTWTDWFSEEDENTQKCPNGMILNRVGCSDRFCNNIRLGCGSITAGYEIVQGDVRETDFFSEEREAREDCPPGYYVYGMTCTGNFCDNIRLHCVRVRCN